MNYTALKLFGVMIVLQLCAIAQHVGYVNPARDIRWPTCAASQYYAPNGNQCFTMPSVVTSMNGNTGAMILNGAGVTQVGNTFTFPGTGGGVTSINGTGGAFTFAGSGVSCTLTTCTFTGLGSGIGSITWSVPSFMTASPSTISASGTQTFSFNTQAPNLVLSGPTVGPSAAPTFRALVSADIPNNAADTIGNAATATGAQAAGSLCGPGSSARGVDSNWNALGCTAIGGGGGTVYNMVTQGGISNTCGTDQSSAITAIITALGAKPLPLYFPPGCYTINAGVIIPCTGTQCQGITIIGAGKASTVFQSTCSGTNHVAWWWNSSLATPGGYWFGPQMRDLAIYDKSGTGACFGLLKTSQLANFIYSNLELDGATGVTRTTGTVSVANGSTTLTGIGTGWTAAMVPSVLRINGKPQFTIAFVSATQLILASAWQQPTASGAAYSLSYGGNALLLDGGNNYEQYGQVYNLTSTGSMTGVFTTPSSSGATGNSRDKFYGGFINPQRIPNSMGFALGSITDSMDSYGVAINNAATCWFIDGGHDNKISGECEDDNAATVVTTCNGGVSAKACINGAEVTGDSGGKTYNNIFDSPLIANVGVGIQVDSSFAINLHVIGIRSASFSNTTNYNFMGTSGCPSSGSGVSATIIADDCIHYQTAVGTTIPHTIVFQDGTPGGPALSTGVLDYFTIPFSCTISSWSIQTDAGTATVKVLKVASGTAIPTLGANSISTSGLSISTGTVKQSTTLTDFTTTGVTANDIIAADLITTSGAGYISFELRCNQ